MWLSAHGVVYAVHDYVHVHPGGARAIVRHAGKDCTEDFDFHSPAAQKLWRRLQIGYVRRPGGCVIPNVSCTVM